MVKSLGDKAVKHLMDLTSQTDACPHPTEMGLGVLKIHSSNNS